jgi:hypothetical protein
VLALAAALLLAQAFLGARAEPVLVLAQTLLVAGVVVGLTFGVGEVQRLERAAQGGAAGALALWPATWFAAPFALGGLWWLAWLAATLSALGVLALAPPAPTAPPRARRTVLELLVAPARALAARVWVRADVRGAFDLVCDALPRERDFVLRTYPMVGIPLAFLALALLGEEGPKRDGLAAVLLFCAGVYLPILLTQVPASASAGASWILATAPVPESAVANGTIKALAVRFLVPLYLVLGAMAWATSGPDAVLRLTLPGALVSLLVLRRLYARFVTAPPLSVAPDEIRAQYDWGGALMGLPFGLVIAAVLAAALVDTAVKGAVLTGALLMLEVAAGRASRRRPGGA